MNAPIRDRPRGILHRDGLPERFRLHRYQANAREADLVDTYWSVSWQLAGHPDFSQELLPHPSMQLVVESERSGVFGIGKGKSVKVLSGNGRAFGIKFWPGAFSALTAKPIAELTGTRTQLDVMFGPAGREYEATVLACTDDEARIAAAEGLLAEQRSELSPEARLARKITDRIAGDRNIVRVDQIAESFALSTRSLQRIFHRYVGVTPKWVIQRYRMHEAVEALEAGGAVDFAQLAARLQFFDQAHFSREFTQLIGRSPARYQRDYERSRESSQGHA